MTNDMKNDILLTIAIPTFNRCDLLDKSLGSIVSSPGFDQRVEIVVSDNFSTDNTRQIVEKHMRSYPNIKYHRNPENISAGPNYIKALSLGSGEYLKLINDSILFKPGTLRFLLDTIEKHLHTKEAIFFYNNTSRRDYTKIDCKDLNDFVQKASFWVTWIGSFGAWRDDFAKLTDKDRYIDLQLAQVDWTFRIVKLHNTVIYCGNFFKALPLQKKGDYNFFQVFIINYLSLYKEYLKSGDIKKITFLKEKYSLYNDFVCPWFNKIYISPNRSSYAFNTHNAFGILFKYYWYYPHLYVILFVLLVHKTLEDSAYPIITKTISAFMKKLQKLLGIYAN